MNALSIVKCDPEIAKIKQEAEDSWPSVQLGLIYVSYVFVILGICAVIIAIVNVPFIRFAETQMWTVIYYLGVGFWLGIMSTIFTCLLIDLKRNGVQINA
jgi:hypothetical protein